MRKRWPGSKARGALEAGNGAGDGEEAKAGFALNLACKLAN
jgi:hypothetical protein